MSQTEATAEKKSRRRWFRFSLRGLLIGVAIVCASLAWRVKAVRNIDNAEASVERLGFDVIILRGKSDDQTNSFRDRPYWLRLVFGEGNYKLAIRGRGAHLVGVTEIRPLLPAMRGMGDIALWNLWGYRVNDDVLRELEIMTNLKALNLIETDTTPAGRERLKKELPGCLITVG